MKFTSTILAFAASLAFVSAQDLGSIPSCALPCFISAIPNSGCSLTDTKCQCTTGQASIAASVASCIPSKCSASDQAKVLQASQDLCNKSGVTVSLSSVAATATGAASGSASGSSSAKATGSASASASGSATSSGTASAATSTQTGAAGEVRGNIMGLGAMVLGAAMLGL